jgi:hypothetical protein
VDGFLALVCKLLVLLRPGRICDVGVDLVCICTARRVHPSYVIRFMGIAFGFALSFVHVFLKIFKGLLYATGSLTLTYLSSDFC